jgi:hypothetical protein
VKGLWSTIALIVILAGLGGYIYFVELKKPASGADTKEKAFSVAPDDVQELRIKAADGDTTHLLKSDGTWRVTEPIKAEADPNEPSSVTSSLNSLEIQRVVDENPSGLKDYGLDPPRIDVAFRTKTDKDLRHLLIGEKTPTGGDLYAMRPGDKRVLLVSSSVEPSFNKGTFDLRDKAVLKFDRGKVDTIELTEGTNGLELRRSGEVEWNIAKPIALRGDFGAIDGILNSLSSTQVQKFLDGETDLAKFGLNKPALTATVRGGGTQATLLIGNDTQGTRYAKDVNRPIVFTVGENLLKDLQKDAPSLRRKDVFDARPYSASRFEFKRGADVVAIDKAKNKTGSEVWKNTAGKELDTEKAADPLNKFTNLRADSFEPAVPAGAKSPELTVTVKFDDNKKTETISFLRAGSDVYATREGEPGAAKIPTSAYEDALKAIDSLK